MDVQTVIGQARDAMSVQRVYGGPHEKDGVTLIPAAAVRGGAGGGDGPEDQGGSGSGFGMSARPVGAFIIKDGDVAWRPAYDATRVALLGEAVVLVGFLVLRGMVKARAKARSRTQDG